MSLIECYWMLQNSSITAFTVFALLRKNQLGGGNKPSTTQIRVNLYERQKACHICKGKFCYDKNKKGEYALYHKFRDHCHYTGKFRGAAHKICNLR